MPCMVTLAQSNRYVRDARDRGRMLADNARQSSIFEGARLPKSGAASHGGFSRAAVAPCGVKRPKRDIDTP